MNLRELINSNARVVTRNNKSYKNFTECQLGSVININTRSHVDHRYGLIHMIMYITAVNKVKAPITIYDKPDKRRKSFTEERRNNVSTYTVAISFSDYWELDVSMNELLNISEDTEEDLYHSKKFEDLTPQEANLYKAQLYKEVRSRNKGKKFSQDELDIEAIKLNRSKPVEQKREELLDIRVSEYIKELAHESKIRTWHSGEENLYEQRQYTSKQLLVHGYTYELEGNNVHIYTPLTVDNRVRVNCTCPQFYYTYAWYNADHQVLIGPKPPAYVKPVGRTLRSQRTADSLTIRNINKRPGMCKHLQFMISYLMNQGILQPLNSTVAKNIYNSQTSFNTIKDTMSNSDKTMGDEKLVKEAEKEFKDYKRELNWAKRKNIEFGEGK